MYTYIEKLYELGITNSDDTNIKHFFFFIRNSLHGQGVQSNI